MGRIMIELIEANDAAAVDLLTKAARAYWEDPFRGYKLVTDTKGPDSLYVRKGAVPGPPKYNPGGEVFSDDNIVVLVFEKRDEAVDAGDAKKGKAGGG